MLAFFRRMVNSRAGVVITFIVLGVIALAFAAGDITGLASSTSGLVGGGSVATIGDEKLTPADLRQRTVREMEGFRAEQPTLDMAAYVAAGGFEATLQRVIGSIALADFGQQVGMVVSKKAVDGAIASIPGLQGITGKFDPQIYRRLLAERKLTDAQVRQDFARDIMTQQLTGPTIGAQQVPEQLALPYASLILEKRAGQVAAIPTVALGTGAPATPAEVEGFYRRNLPRYSVPERRVARYAMVDPSQAQATATDAEIARAYAADAKRYAATEKRTVAQVVVADQAGATALAARVRGGTPLAAAARAAGLEASTQTGVEKPAFAATTSPAVADAVFAAAQGAVVGPVRGPLGYVVARVERVEQVAARPLAAVRGEIAAALSKQKSADALSAIREAVDDALAGNATFDEVVGDRKLAARTTPAVTVQGVNPEHPEVRIDPALAPVVTALFQAADGDAPQLVNIGTGGAFAVVAVGRVLPAAPRPLAQVREEVARDFVADRQRQAARRVAAAVVAKVNRGMPLAQALAETKLTLPAPRPLAAPRALLAQDQRAAQGPLGVLFSLAQNKARLVPSPEGQGWLVLRLDRIERGDASRSPGVVSAARRDLAQLVGREYADQFARAARDAVGVKTDAAALGRVRAELLGQPGPTP